MYREHQQGERCTSDMMHCEHQAICTVHITPYEPYTVNIELVSHEHQHDELCTSTTEHCEHQQRERCNVNCKCPSRATVKKLADMWNSSVT